ncbi:MAG TPA: MG2 domain-containing protein [Acetobacteraceae bacterium]|nr:MG2 domain-containing protein [Acetobacteraceae bacterium]
MFRTCRILFLLLIAFAAAPPRSAWSQQLDLPGLSADAASYVASLQKLAPAGMSAAAREAAEADAEKAIAAGDWAKALAALQQRLGAGHTTPDLWLSLAKVLIEPPTPDDAHALAAAWQAYVATEPGPAQLPSLAIMRTVLAALGRKLPEIEVLEEETQLAPDDADLRRELIARRQEFGLLVRKVTTQPESFPARVCIAFTGQPGGTASFHAGDWVRLDPPVRDAAVTLESGNICIAGLDPGATTKVTLLAGMPGTDGLSLKQATTLSIAMPNRMPRLVFDSARFLQPSSMPALVSLASVNLSAVKLDLVQISERGLQAFFADHPVGSSLDSYDVDSLLTEAGRPVWNGSAAIPDFTRNALLHTQVPLPDVMTRPGLYVLLARPGDGTPVGDNPPLAMQMVLRTNLAPTIWRGSDGLTVQVRAYSDAAPKENVSIALISSNNDVLATETTDAEGIAHFAAPLLMGAGGLAPSALHLSAPDGDFTLLDLTEPVFDLSDRGVSGRPEPGPLDAFVWLDRGIYRPGETVHMMALVRDSAARPADVPLHVIVTRPGGQIFADLVPKQGDDDALNVPITLSGGAQAGEWQVALSTAPDAPDIADAHFQVEAFVPARLAVEFGTAPAPLPPGRSSLLPVSARFLYGAPGAGLTGEGSVSLLADPTPFPAFSAYRFGLADEMVPDDTATFDLAETDEAGKTAVPVDLSHLPDVTEALAAEVMATIDDPAGRSVTATETVPIRPAVPLIGLRPEFAGGAVNPGTPASFDVVAVDPGGGAVAMQAQVSLVRLVPDWRLSVQEGVASYQMVWREEPVDSRTVQIPPDHPLVLSWRLDYGRYKLVVAETGQGLAAASTLFDSGWSVSGNPDIPARVRLAADHASYRAGQVAHVHITPPFAGPATLLVLTDRVRLIRNITLPAAGEDVDVKVSADWGAGAYVAVHVFRPILGAPGAKPQLSDRAIGVTWLQIDPAARTVPVSFAVPSVLRPRGAATVILHTTPGAWLTLAAVDEGILQLTGFASPDPVGYFFGRRALGVDIHDEWARLLRPAEGELTALHQGGGGEEEGPVLPPIPQQVVALFTPPAQADKDGIARITLALPDFDGELRLMAVAWSGDKVGAAHDDVLVRDPLVAEALLPRFLAPGDSARLAVLLQNVELPAGAVSVHLAASGAISLKGPDTLQTTLAAGLAAGAREVLATTLSADGVGTGHIALDVAGPGGFTARHEADISVHPARGPIVTAEGGEIAPGATVTLAPDMAGFLPGTWKATLSLGGAVRYDVAALVRALAIYPLDCLEQAASRGLPLAMLPDGAAAGPDRAGRLQQAIESVLDRQRYDGAFGLWSSDDEADPWLTAYATEFLLRARKAGAPVPETALNAALSWLAGEASEADSDDMKGAAKVYAAYVLALAGQAPAGAIRVMQQKEATLPTPLARAQLAASLARIDEPDAARSLFDDVLANPGREFWAADYGSALRDQAATSVLVRESGLDVTSPERLADALPGANLDPASLDTQEQAWAAAAAASLGASAPPLSVSIGGKALAPAASASLPFSGPIQVRNTGTANLRESITVTGIPRVPAPAAQHLMGVSRLFFTPDGKAIDPDTLPQNTVFVMLVEGGALDGEAHQAMLLAGLPAGWEIAGRFSGGKVPGMDWLGTLSDTAAQMAADDRFAAALNLTAQQPKFRIAVMLRAVTPGNYELPGLELSDMYRPAIFAREASTRIDVSPP